jgi:hypothetical protein
MISEVENILSNMETTVERFENIGVSELITEIEESVQDLDNVKEEIESYLNDL